MGDGPLAHTNLTFDDEGRATFSVTIEAVALAAYALRWVVEDASSRVFSEWKTSMPADELEAKRRASFAAEVQRHLEAHIRSWIARQLEPAAHQYLSEALTAFANRLRDGAVDYALELEGIPVPLGKTEKRARKDRQLRRHSMVHVPVAPGSRGVAMFPGKREKQPPNPRDMYAATRMAQRFSDMQSELRAAGKPASKAATIAALAKNDRVSKDTILRRMKGE